MKSLKDYYNNETKTLTLPYKFNNKLKNIPENTENIIFDYSIHTASKFNQKIDNLPQSLIKLFLGKFFNKKVDFLPKNLIHLLVGEFFNQEINNLPKNLKSLEFGINFSKK